MIEMLTLALAGELFAFEAVIVSEILDLGPITRVPNAPAHAPGLINVRGKVVPLIDLKVLLDMAPTEKTIDTRIVVVDLPVEGERISAAILADKVYEVATTDPASLDATPRTGMKWPAEFIRGIGRRNSDFLIILDIPRIFASGLL